MFNRISAIATLAVAALAAAPVYAKGSSHEDPFVPAANATIVSKDQATGFVWTQRWTNDSLGNIVICPAEAELDRADGTCLNKKRFNVWQTVEQTIPTGRKYIGFQLLSTRNGVFLVLYYK